ncbi:MAG: futalosine hydrolase, partial [Planctomycetota bacterium]|nr:futalosine hydrolase [Planctomycetota bacterium]
MTCARGDLLVVAATAREALPFQQAGLATVISGVGRVNAAIATTLALTERRESPLVLSVGICGALPTSAGPEVGDLLIGDRAVYAEEGILTPDGFQSIDTMGFPLARFVVDNSIPADESALARLQMIEPRASVGAIATVATCSGTDVLAVEIARRTGAVAEAMEGAAVLHAAAALGAPAIEVRSVS